MKIQHIIAIAILTFLQISCDTTKKKEAEKPVEETVIEEKQETNYTKLGMEIAMATQKELGKNLKGAMKKGGPEHALAFCNTKAFPLTDSMAVAHKAKIKRVTDKARNMNNQANDTELAHIQTFKDAIAKGEKPTPIVEEKDNIVHFYAPIITADVCLKCHAPADKIKPSVLATINKLYPKDAAKGYEANQIRGIWSIEMEAQK